MFPGAPVILHGHNRNLGWASTVNHPDFIDVYVLDINPDNPYQYRFDGKWLDLDVRTAAIKVKLFGPISWTFKRETLWSVYGPVLRRPHGTYAVRYVGMGGVRQLEQWYRMNKTRDLGEWLDAMRMMAIPMFNFGYADGNGNICYLYNGNLPVRAESYFDDFLAPDPACYLTDEEIGITPDSVAAEEAARWPVPVQQQEAAA